MSKIDVSKLDDSKKLAILKKSGREGRAVIYCKENRNRIRRAIQGSFAISICFYRMKVT